MLLCVGILAALFERSASGLGQVVDASVLDGAALLTATARFLHDAGHGTDFLSGHAHFYDAFECSDGGYVTFGALDSGNYAELLERLGLPALPQWDRDAWPGLREEVAAVVQTRTRADWQTLLEGTDVCFAPVLSLDEAPEHPHNRARGTFVRVGDSVRPAPAPRFSRTPAVARL
jgi:alpha-methylacyl-CoA racemase